MGFVHEVRVRYGECDAQGVVFNANWLVYVDDALTEYFRHLGYPPQETWLEHGEFDVMNVAAELRWVSPGRFDDRVAIAVAPTRLGTKSFDLRYAASIDGRDAFEATITYVTIAPAQDNATIAIPDHLRQRLDAELVPEVESDG